MLIALLKRICRSEGIDADKEALQVIVENSRGDVRSAVNDLQSLAEGRKTLKVSDVERLSPRDRQADVQETLRKMFLAENFEQARRALDESDIDYEMLLLTIHDNLPFKYVDSTTLASAYNNLSRADVFLGRITRTQSWSLLSYALELMAAGIAYAGEAGRRPAVYRFPPDKIMLLARTKAERELRKNLCLRVGSKCHVSSRVANNDFLPFMKVIFRNDASLASSMASWLQLEDEMVKYLKQVEAS
jgi:replication factor C large subunit